MHLHEQLSDFQPFVAVVVGDFMLDQQIRGAAERLSPEAPVPILRVASREDVTSTPGGASNVAACLGALDARVRCVGVVGDDEEGGTLRSGLTESGCHVEGLLTDTARTTTIKRSLVGLAQHRHPQKMFRLDFESSSPLDPAIEEALMAAIDTALDGASIACIEDYGKGVCSERICAHVIARSADLGIPVLVDPAAREDFSRYGGATVITPNRSEAELATQIPAPSRPGIDHGRALAVSLQASANVGTVVVTLDKDGAILLEGSGDPVHVPTCARTVYDVTGAGDMVLAAIGAGMANGLAMIESVRLANIAAGLEVETFGARPIPLAELRQELLVRSPGSCPPLRSLDELLPELAEHRASGKRIVLTNGCFDVIHAGHVAYLREARGLGDILVVGVNADEQVTALKGPQRPIFNEQERLEILGELKCIDYLVVFAEETSHELIRAVAPDVFAKGGDYLPEDIAEFDLLSELGIDVRVLAHRPGLGSTELIERIRSEA